jgi:hypothetical protein
MNYITLTDKDDGYKIPKGYIQNDASAQRALNISDLTCTVVYDYSYGQKDRLKVVGEIASDALVADTLIYVMVYNKDDILIGCDFDAVIRKSSFNGFTTFQTSVYIPEGASISKIVIRPGANPVMVR